MTLTNQTTSQKSTFRHNDYRILPNWLTKSATTLVLLGACSIAHAEEASAPTDPELAKMQLEAEKYKAQAEAAKAQRAIFEASLPPSSSKGLTGAMELDKVNIESYIQTYKALSKVTQTIADEIVASGAKTVVIRNNNDINGLLALKVTERQMDFLDEQYNKILNPPPGVESGGALLLSATAASLLGSIGDVAAFFKTDTKISGVDVALNNSGVIPSLALHLRGKATVYYPELLPVNALGQTSSTTLSDKIQLIGALYDQAKPHVDVYQAVQKVKELEARLAAAKDPDKPAIQKLLDAAKADPDYKPGNVHRHAAKLAALNATTDKLFTALAQSDAMGISNLAKLENANDLRDVLKKADTRVLELTPQKGGGNNKTTSRVFGSAKDHYSGGAIVSFVLLAPDGTIARSGNVSAYAPYARPNDIKR